jgi:hypothetical protein
MQPALPPWHSVSQPATIVVKVVEFLPWPRIQNPRKTHTFTVSRQEPFLESYNKRDMRKVGINAHFVQDNHL